MNYWYEYLAAYLLGVLLCLIAAGVLSWVLPITESCK